MPDAEPATFACAYTTAENLLDRAQVADGDVVVVTGASGGVDGAAIQPRAIRGATVIAVSTGSRAENLPDLGAAVVVDRHTPDLGAPVLEATPSGSIDAVADVVGAPNLSKLVPLLRPGGRYTSSGCIAGPVVELDLRNLGDRDLQFGGATVCQPGTFHRIVEHIEAGRLRPQLAATYPLERLREAQLELVREDHAGNIVVEVPSPAG